LLRLGVLGNGEDARQTGKRIAAQGIIDELVNNDAHIVVRQAHPPKCTLSQRCGLRHAQAYRIGRILVEQSTGGTQRWRGHALISPSLQRRNSARHGSLSTLHWCHTWVVGYALVNTPCYYKGKKEDRPCTIWSYRTLAYVTAPASPVLSGRWASPTVRLPTWAGRQVCVPSAL